MSTSSGPHPPQYFSLRWNNHPANLVSMFSGLYSSETLVDVTLAAEGKHIQAHKMLLSACSDYFQSLFSINPCQHPIVILKDVQFEDLETVVQFMYNGVVNVSSEKLTAVLKTADTLQIKGLGEKFSESVNQMMGGRSNPRLLSVPSQHSVNSRQLSTESLPEYLHRTGRDFSSRQASTDSRQYSMESCVSALVRKHPTPPASPPRRHQHYRKKFRRLSAGGGGSSSERGNSLEDDRSQMVASSCGPSPSAGAALATPSTVATPSTLATPRSGSPPTIHLSPSRQSSSSTDHGGGETGVTNTTGLGVAKKKRELFSARSSRSGGSNKSSASEYSREASFKPLESSSSSGLSHSMTQSQDEVVANCGATNLTTSNNNTNATNTTTTTTSATRTITRTQSAGESSVDPSLRSSPLPPKRSRMLRRQDCLEKGMDLTTEASAGSIERAEIEAAGIIKSSPNSPLMNSFSYMGSPSNEEQKMLSLIPGEAELTLPSCISPTFQQHPLIKQKSNETLRPPSPYYSLDPVTSNPSSSLHHRVLPSVRVIPDPVDPMSMDPQRLPIPNMRLLCPPEFSERRPLGKQRSSESMAFPSRNNVVSSSPFGTTSFYDPVNFGSDPGLPATTTSFSSHQSSPPDQFGHCPKARDGPALGCNYCWNTTDANGRILRRKTKYHCPECQANLCIVPCFQQYHEALERDKGMQGSQ